MKLLKSLSLLTVAGSLAAAAHAQAFFQASLWAPEPQIVPADKDVAGIRLQLYGENRNVTGLHLGLAHSTTGDFVGFAGFYTLCNQVGCTTTGFQSALVNYTQGEVTGWQSRG